jgi:hypothetical protein
MSGWATVEKTLTTAFSVSCAMGPSAGAATADAPAAQLPSRQPYRNV